MEHPGIKGLMLTKKERVYEPLLEYINSDGELLFESIPEKMCRMKWRTQAEITPSNTEANFVTMNNV